MSNFTTKPLSALFESCSFSSSVSACEPCRIHIRPQVLEWRTGDGYGYNRTSFLYIDPVAGSTSTSITCITAIPSTDGTRVTTSTAGYDDQCRRTIDMRGPGVLNGINSVLNDNQNVTYIGSQVLLQRPSTSLCYLDLSGGNNPYTAGPLYGPYVDRCLNTTTGRYFPDFASQFPQLGQFATCEPLNLDSPVVLTVAPWLTQRITVSRTAVPITTTPAAPVQIPAAPTLTPTPTSSVPAIQPSPKPVNNDPLNPVANTPVQPPTDGDPPKDDGPPPDSAQSAQPAVPKPDASARPEKEESSQPGQSDAGQGTPNVGRPGQVSSGQSQAEPGPSGKGSSGQGQPAPSQDGQNSASPTQGSSGEMLPDLGSSPEQVPSAQSPGQAGQQAGNLSPTVTAQLPRITSAMVIQGQTLRPNGAAATIAQRVISVNSQGSVVVVSMPTVQANVGSGTSPSSPGSGSSGGSNTLPAAVEAVTMDLQSFKAQMTSLLGTSVEASMVTYFAPARTTAAGAGGVGPAGTAGINGDEKAGAVVTEVGQIVGGIGAYILSAIGQTAGASAAGAKAAGPRTTGVLQQSGSGRSGSTRNGTVQPFTGSGTTLTVCTLFPILVASVAFLLAVNVV
ncbi:Indoleamine 2,3-dioxygenase 1 [Sphaceloma murrayae]|uniref:Indoleamine 2,3-dioxygenase 1 n=1 Tax=Sphaceloma murrayae TaxID=2082308 RepID=A0A2K1QKW2_9PEZI|nr:Indoleamine 2,3-dioxygenase 1 [Sphaceloma murrayae]